ncbi:hypothetical protein K461DRAFT_232285 [Myriangium duriaei CBS 260.36]|uniref:Zn(2)-C6 fungal-type domain-containing protein n=1 Tax=Myriangium duriaei CBS 260.36 TaxID=1168546 RepID=A0A9P4MDH0_9PEZI|nr:hypothetical protein K461DRAFT_232285 [Myriangium duriaei CBS 260.36]
MADPSGGLSSTAASRQQVPSPPAAKESPSSSNPRIRRRNRVIASCLECRRRKLKCDKLAPCTNCSKFRRDCLYLATTLDTNAQQKLAEIKDRMGNLEQVLERDVARKSSTDKVRRFKADIDSEDDDEPEYEDEKDMEPTPFASLDQVYEDDADDDLMDLGVQLGKLRVSERIGGFVRPRMAEEANRVNRHSQQPQQQSGSQYQPMSANYPNNNPLPPDSQNWLLSDSPSAYLGPGPDYIAPASNFFFSASNQGMTLRDHLPARATCDMLLEQYWRSCHPVVTIVHKPSFLSQYNLFWQHIMIGTEPPASTQAVIFACLFMAAVSVPEATAVRDYGVPRAVLIERLKTGTEVCLAKANFLRTTKLETMQAFVMFLIPLCRAEVSRAHSALTGTAIRLAECMGLHRDGTLYGFSPVETHVRRLVWYHLCFLDIRTCEATGPRLQIHKEDYDTKLPLNVNEADLLNNPPPTEDLPYFTDMTLTRIRFETSEMHRVVWAEQSRIDQKKTKPGVVLGKIQKFRTDIEARILPLITGSDPRQILALHLYRVLSSRLYIMVLHRFFAGAMTPMPDRLRRILIDACLASNEFIISLETRAELSAWAWYRGAIFQYHSAMLLLFESMRDPSSEDIPRIWKVLDYVFELPQNMSNSQKADSVMFALRDRLGMYHSMRKLKAPKRADDALKEILQIQLDEANGSKVTPPASEQLQMNFGTQTTAQMAPTQFSMPPMYHVASNSDSGSQSAPYGSHGSPLAGTQTDNPIDSKMSDDIWSDWDKLFQPDASDFGLANLPDFNLGSFTPFVPPGHDRTAFR